MTTKTSTNSKPADVFKTFPEFSKLTLADRGKYEALIRDYPPVSDLSFQTLMLWWNVLESCAVSQLNGNLIISYWLPGLEDQSGLSVIGDNKIEETMCAVFDHLRDLGERPRLVHIPEFVMANIEHPDMFVCKSERMFDEYIFPVSNFYPLKHVDSFRRKRVENFINRVGNKSIVIKGIDFNDEENLETVRWCVTAWRKTGHLNDSVKIEEDAIAVGLKYHDLLGVENLCLYVDGELQGFCLYYYSHDRRYAVLTNARLNDELPWTLDYALYGFAQKLSDEGVTFINMECDLGSKFMRTLKLSLGPSGFFRKYTIEPAF